MPAGSGNGSDSTARSSSSERERASSLIIDEASWARVGEELRRVDPQRFAAILKVAEDICAIHRDPLCGNLASGHFVFSGGGGDDFD